MDEPQAQSADRPNPAQAWDIPDTSVELGHRVRVDRWNQQAWPPLTFGVPEGWSDVPVDQFAWLPVERRIPAAGACPGVDNNRRGGPASVRSWAAVACST